MLADMYFVNYLIATDTRMLVYTDVCCVCIGACI